MDNPIETLNNNVLLSLSQIKPNENIKNFFKELNTVNKNIDELTELNKSKKKNSEINYTLVPVENIVNDKILLGIFILVFNNTKQDWNEYLKKTILEKFNLIKGSLVNIRSKDKILETLIKGIPSDLEQLKNVLSYLGNEMHTAGKSLNPLITKSTDFRLKLEALIRAVKESFTEEKLKKEINFDVCINLLSNVVKAFTSSVFYIQAVIDNFYSIYNRIDNIKNTISDLKTLDKKIDAFISDLYLTLYKTAIPPTEIEIDTFLSKFIK